MSGSVFGTLFKISTWGESHGKALGVVIDGCPSGIYLSENDFIKDMSRRKPGNKSVSTKRNESDKVEILSGVFEGKTTGAPLSLLVYNEDHISRDYENIKDVFRPGHADYTYYEKYGIRDYRGGGRSSGRETLTRVAAGVVAKKILEYLDINVFAYTNSISDIFVSNDNFDIKECSKNPLFMPDAENSKKAMEYITNISKDGDSVGGTIKCIIKNLPKGLGQPVFDKLDADLAKAIFSIGAVKGFEIGLGFNSSTKKGSQNNDIFYTDETGEICKKTNNSGGILGGISDGDDIVLNIAIKPTPSISIPQETVTTKKESTIIKVSGRHDPVIVPRAVVVVEAMVSITLVDHIFMNMVSKIENISSFYKNSK